MGNACCSGESLSDAERKELEELRRKKNEYSQKDEEKQVVSTQRQNYAEQQQIKNFPSKVDETRNNHINRASEDNLNQVIQGAIWPPVIDNQEQYGHEQIQNNVWPPLDNDNSIGCNSKNNQVIDESLLNENIEHNIWPPSSLPSSHRPDSNINTITALANHDSEVMNNNFTNNIWPPPSDRRSTNYTDIQKNIWPPPTASNDDEGSAINQDNLSAATNTDKNVYATPNTKDNVDSIRNNQQLKLEKPHLKSDKYQNPNSGSFN